MLGQSLKPYFAFLLLAYTAKARRVDTATGG